MPRIGAAVVALCLAASPPVAAADFASLSPAFFAPPNAAPPVSADVLAQLAFAAQLGDTAIVDAVARLTAADPGNAPAIVAAAVELAPDAAPAIFDAAGEIAVVPAAGPAALPLAPIVVGAGGAAGVAGVAGAGGGGGGGDDDATSPAAPAAPPDDDPTDPPADDGDPPPPPPDPTPFETAEYRAQPGLAAVNAATAYARGLDGTGVIVAVIDGPVDATDPELAGAVITTAAAVVEPVSAAATHAAKWIGARRDGIAFHGVAPAATILSSRSHGRPATVATNTRDAQRARVLHNAWDTDRAPVINFSAAAFPAAELAAYREVVARGNAVVVHAAGDGPADNTLGGAPHPSLRAGLPHLFPDLQPAWLAVTATGADGVVTTSANRCGVAAAWCLAAPAAPQTAAPALSSTARAAPHVSGAAALLTELFPELSAEAIAARLLATANRDGIYADADTYGQGFLDLAAATAPLGPVAVAAAPGQPANLLAGSRLRPGAAFGTALTAGLAGTSLAVVDSQGAVFAAPFAGLLDPTETADLLDAGVKRFAAGLTEEEIALAPNLRLGFTNATRGHLEVDHKATTWRFSTTDARPRPTAAPTADLLSDAHTMPFRALAPRRTEIAVAQSATPNTELVTSAFFGGDDLVTAVGSATELTWRDAGFSFSARAGALIERDTVLGTHATGAVAFAGDTPTYHAGVSFAAPLPGGFRVDAAAAAGVTMAAPGAASVIGDVTPIRSTSLTLGVARNHVAGPGDEVGIVAHQPLRVTAGSLAVPDFIGRDGAGRVLAPNRTVSLTPTGRALDIEAYYHRPLPRGGAVAVNALWRRHPGHDGAAPAEGIVAARWRHRF